MTVIERAEELRQRGQAEDAVGLLAQAVADGETAPEVHAYLAVALFDAGHPKAAMATLLGALLEHADVGDHEQALGEIQRALLENSQA